MRIIVDTPLNRGPAEYANMGDVAMLQVAVSRLLELRPSARIEVLTDSPENLAVFCPGTHALPRAGRHLWVADREILGAFAKILPSAVLSGWDRLCRVIKRRFPELFSLALSARLRIRDRQNRKQALDAYLAAMKQADLFLVCGAGGFTDSTRDFDLPVLGTLEHAIQLRIATAMLGQGMGPLTNPEVLTRARKILPLVDLISLRGARGGPALLESLGVPGSAALTTGDEALEPAYQSRRPELGEAIGINLRIASYSGVGRDQIDLIKPVLHGFARRHRLTMLPVPIAFHAWADDCSSIRSLLAGFDDHSDGGASLKTPVEVIRQIGACRLVITGAYHAAVFALAQGIPVVGLAASQDYLAKFHGLRDLFGHGCELVILDEPDAPHQLAAAMEKAWSSAESLRVPLLAAANRQIQSSRSAYQKILQLVADRKVPDLKTMPRSQARCLEEAKL